MKKAVTIISGGLDSTTLVYYLASLGYDQTLLSFHYGQRHNKELNYAAKTAGRFKLPWKVVDVSDFGSLLKGSSLSDSSVPVPEGHYSAANMALTVVPNRNAIMLSMAWGVASAINAESLAYGAHIGDRAQYPDCRLEFVTALENALLIGTEGCRNEALRLNAPFLTLSKAEIVKLGHQLSVKFEDTWSCYKGEEKHCGRCGTCVERLEAFEVNGLVDPTEYTDREYWRKAVAEFDASDSEDNKG